MTIANLAFNPFSTTNAAGLFATQSDGLVQGVAMDDPTVRNRLAGGLVSTVETIPMWGGIAICENVPPSTQTSFLMGGSIQRATSVASTIPITGFSVLNQGHAGQTTPQNTVPVFLTGQTINFYRMGSGARIAVKCDPSLVSLDGTPISSNVSWDFNNQVLQPYDASTATVSVTSVTASYASGLWTFAVVAAAASLVGAIGDFINLSGITGTGASLMNGNQRVTAYTSSTVFSFQIAGASDTFVAGAQSGTIVLNEGTVALPVKILGIQPTGNMTVDYNAVTGVASWNTNGPAALIQI